MINVRMGQEYEERALLLPAVLGLVVLLQLPAQAASLAPAISIARVSAARNGRQLEFVAVVIGTDDDPQNYTAQVERLRGDVLWLRYDVVK